jgi:hypothetical protein
VAAAAAAGGVRGRPLDWAQQQERRPGWKRSGSGRRRCTSTLGTRRRSSTRRRRPGPSPHHHRAPRIQQSMCDESILGSSWTSRSNGTRGGLVLGYISSFNLLEPGAHDLQVLVLPPLPRCALVRPQGAVLHAALKLPCRPRRAFELPCRPRTVWRDHLRTGAFVSARAEPGASCQQPYLARKPDDPMIAGKLGGKSGGRRSGVSSCARRRHAADLATVGRVGSVRPG